MADRILTWYVENPKNTGSEGMTYILDRSYALPAIVRIHAGDAPDGDDLEIDIKDDGSSIFTNLPVLDKGESSTEEEDDFNIGLSMMEQFSLVTLEIPQSGGAKRISVTLELQREFSEPLDDELD